MPSKSHPSARLAKAGPGSPRLTAAWSPMSQIRHTALTAETPPRKGVPGTKPSDAVGLLPQEAKDARRIHDGIRRWGRILEEGPTKAY